jgi:hypothetical protein
MRAKPVSADGTVASDSLVRWRRAVCAVLASFVFLSVFGSADRAQASQVGAFTATSSTYSAGASSVKYSIQFTATTALTTAATDYVELTAPTGSALSTSTGNYHVQANGTSPARTSALSVVVNPGGAGDNVADVYVPNDIAQGATVVVDAYMSTNPPTANSNAKFSMSTSQDTTPTAGVAFAITSQTAVSGLTATASSPYAGSQEVEDTVTFTATSSIIFGVDDSIECPQGDCSQGDIFLTAPTGTQFNSFGQDYAVNDLTTQQKTFEVNGAAVSPGGAGDNVVELAPSITINAGDQVQVLAYEVVNPTLPESGTFSVITTSDIASPASPPAFDYGAAVAPTNVSVATTSTTASATGTTYLIGLTTKSALPMFNGGSDGTGFVILTLPSGISATGFDNGTVSMSDTSRPVLQPSGTSPGQYGVSPPNNVVDIPMAFATPANDHLTIKLTGVRNPSTFSLPTVSTTGDTVAVPPSLPTGVSATAGPVSAEVSWTAPSLPSGATVDYIITPFIGATAQTPVDTLSSNTSFDVTGLTNGVSYTFKVQAKVTDSSSTVYAAGTMSAASNAVTPTASTGGPPKATPSATTLAFGTEFLRETTAAQTVKLFNTGGNPLSVSGVSITGADKADYAITADACAGHSVAGSSSCSVTVTFTPQASGARPAALEFTDNASGSPQSVALTGTGADTATVSGKVSSNTTGAPIGGVVVYICAGTHNGEVASTCGSATTNASGDYTLSGLTLGVATVNASPQSAASLSYHGQVSATTLVLGAQTLDITLPALQRVGAGVTITGADSNGGLPTPDGGPMTVAYAPQFPSEPAGTVLAYVATGTVSEVDTVPAVLGWSGAVTLLVSYGSSGTPTVIGQYSDTASGPNPALNFQATSPGASQGLIGPAYQKLSPMLLQYLPNEQLQATYTPGELYPGTKQFQICTRTAVVSSSNASVQVQASSGAYAFGAVSPAPTVSGSSCGVTFNEYFDPSGKVESTTGIPLESATVKLVRSVSKKGPFKAVPKGSTIMSTSNRRDPDHTTVLGVFGWNTIPGYYRVQASHPGCTAGGSGRKAKKTIETRIYKVPPPVDNIVIKLKCKGLKRSKTHVRLKLKTTRGTTTATATVIGKSPQGGVTFSGAGVSGVSIPVGARTHQATFVLTKAHQQIKVHYLGDAHNAPSVASGQGH